MSRQSQSGNVLFLILIAVALFAAVSIVVSQSTRTGGTSADREKLLLELNRVHSYSVGLKMAISRMLTAGVSINQISFEHTGFSTDYSNANCTTPQCKIFDQQGGSAIWDKPPTIFSSSDYIITGYNRVKGIGTDTAGDSTTSELMIIVRDISENSCKIINQSLGMEPTAAIPIDTTGCLVDTAGTNYYYKGTFAAGNVVEDTGDATALQSKFEMCVRCTGSPDRFHFYSVIMAR
jgi:hypothetical protein